MEITSHLNTKYIYIYIYSEKPAENLKKIIVYDGVIKVKFLALFKNQF